jgi:hypothetical protein
MKKNCEHCGNSYESKDVRQMYCTDSCKTKAYNKRKTVTKDLPPSMKMEKGKVKPNNLNPAYQKGKSAIDSLIWSNRFDEIESNNLNERIAKVTQTKKHKPYWQAGYGILGAFGGVILANLIVKPFLKEKTIETKQEDEAGNTTVTTQRIGLAVWQIVALFVVIGAGVALWWFEATLTKGEALIPTQQKEIDELQSKIIGRTLSIETANKSLELIPKFNLPDKGV